METGTPRSGPDLADRGGNSSGGAAKAPPDAGQRPSGAGGRQPFAHHCPGRPDARRTRSRCPRPRSDSGVDLGQDFRVVDGLSDVTIRAHRCGFEPRRVDRCPQSERRPRSTSTATSSPSTAGRSRVRAHLRIIHLHGTKHCVLIVGSGPSVLRPWSDSCCPWCRASIEV